MTDKQKPADVDAASRAVVRALGWGRDQARKRLAAIPADRIPKILALAGKPGGPEGIAALLEVPPKPKPEPEK